MIDIRIADKNDISVIADIINETWKVTYKDIVSEKDIIKYTDKTNREDQISDFLNKGELEYLIASHNSSDCGVISYKKYDKDDYDDCAYIMQLYILPDFQKIGIGKALMAYVTDTIKEKGYKRIILNTLEKNSNARAFYEKLGYEYIGAELSPLFSEKIVRALYKKEL